MIAGNGKQIRFWLDSCVVDGPPIDFIDPTESDNANIYENVRDSINQDKTWNIQLLTQVILIHNVRITKTIRMPMQDIPDKKMT